MTDVVLLHQVSTSSETEQRRLEDLADECLRKYFQTLNGVSPVPNMYSAVMHKVEKPLLENVLRYVKGNQVRASAILGINRNTLRKKIQTLGIDLAALDSRNS